MSKLIFVGLPIGNVDDISIRALRTIFLANNIACEDTRNFLKLISILEERYNDLLEFISLKRKQYKNLISYREQNHTISLPKILNILGEGEDIVYVSDAGMPSISDPGQKLATDVLKFGFELDVVPGPTAIETALVLSGIKCDSFCFFGFLPKKTSKVIKVLQDVTNTTVFYESPYRIVKTLNAIEKNFSNYDLVLCKELTKKFQRVFRGDAKSILEKIKHERMNGEWVLIVNQHSSGAKKRKK